MEQEISQNESLRSLLCKAFDEGSESPYDLRESVINGLMAQIEGEADQDLASPLDLQATQQIAEQIHTVLPPTVKRLLQQNDIWLCGGSILGILVTGYLPGQGRGWPESDYDLFCSQIPDFAHDFLENGNYNNTKSLLGVLDGQSINVIVKEEFINVSAILETFDFTLAQFGFWYSDDFKPTAFCTKETWRDIALSQIRLNKKYRNHINDKTTERVTKYIKRGFRDCTGLIEAGLIPSLLTKCL